MEEGVKGTVTSLSSLFPPEEAQKASKRVQDTIADYHKELVRLREFVADNTNLVNLVQKLPDELHHEIMVPFGKAAFFPGRLIHTNEFLVLLGEGYFAERTSKQTTEILKRRGKVLESQVESLKAVMQDLKAEASFFDATATEAAEGLVEIREEYTEDTSTGMVSKTGSKGENKKVGVEDEEFARLFSRMDELEKEEEEEEEELEAESLNVRDEHEEIAPMMSSFDELEKEKFAAKNADESDEGRQTEADFDHSMSQQPISPKHQNQKFDGPKLQPILKGGSSDGKSLVPNKSNFAEKAFMLPEVEENVQATSTAPNEVSIQTSQPSGGFKAFTGTIVEHNPNVAKNPTKQTTASSKSSTSQGSKTISRFKMQRR